MFLQVTTAIIACIGCVLSVYNFFDSFSRKHFEKACLVETRYLNVKISNNQITSIYFRFCLVNISNISPALRKISFNHPALNNGKSFDIDEIGHIIFDFGNSTQFAEQKKERKSISERNASEVLPYILKPSTKYEGSVSIFISDDMTPKPILYRNMRPDNMVVTMLFDRPQRFVVPIKYVNSPKKDILN
ncbi:MAG: hypothetical protein RRY06_08500 [Lachnospiraceae bacterium]